MPALAYSFPPIAALDARLLILGSMPGVASLEAQQYYAHPRNAFWPIMADLFDFDAAAPYAERCEQLRSAGVAVWDVLRTCRRKGSLDSAIETGSEQPNDFIGFFAEHPSVRMVAFNGQKAESAFCRHVTPLLDPATQARLSFAKLSSTSPAHAARSFEEKLAAWRLGLSLR